MPSTSNDSFKFFVYIVESPSASDIYHGRSEGGLVAQALSLDLIPCVARTAINPVAFFAALKIGLLEAMGNFREHLPILHLSAHGGESGLQLSNEHIISWNQLRDLVIPINESLGGNLLLCMSACEGYSACQMAMRVEDAPHPYFGFVGNYEKPTWSDTAVAYSAFYHRLSKGARVGEAVEAMKIASGNSAWVCETAEEAKRGFIEYLNQVNPPAARQKLEEDAENKILSPDAKALERGAG